VTSSKVEKNYDICGFTYDLALERNGTFTIGSKEASTEVSVRTAFDLLDFALAGGAGGGQTLINANTDYLGLPASEEAKTNVLTIARAGVKRISF
jgi:hypothetical protein